MPASSSPEEPTVSHMAPGRRPVRAVDLYRFILELAMLAGLGYCGWQLGQGGLLGLVLALLLPFLGAVIWGVFATAGEPGRGKTVIDTPGPIRLVIELALFGGTAAGVWVLGSRAAAETLLTVTVLQYALDWERNWWMLSH